MTQRFEFEIDTERAVDFWKKEVEENLAAGRFVTSDPRIESYKASQAEPAGVGGA